MFKKFREIARDTVRRGMIVGDAGVWSWKDALVEKASQCDDQKDSVEE